MSPEVERFAVLTALELVLLGIEVFIPGGVVGMVGGFLLLCAMVAGFIAFGAEGGWVASALMIVLGGIGLMAWIKLFPKTPMGRRLTLTRSGADFKTLPGGPLPDLLGKDGTAHTDLRPSGVAQIGTHRVDVVSESGYVAAGSAVRVTAVEGARVVVRRQLPS